MTKEQRHAQKMALKKKQHEDSVATHLSRKFISEQCDQYLEHMDLIFLKTLIDELGIPVPALEAWYYKAAEVFSHYKTRYAEADKNHRELYFNEVHTGDQRSDHVAVKMHLKAAGFDYDQTIQNIIDGVECSSDSVAMLKECRRACEKVGRSHNNYWIDPVQFSKWLKRRMKEENIPVAALSEATGVGAAAIAMYRRGRARPRSGNFELLQNELGIYTQTE